MFTDYHKEQQYSLEQVFIFLAEEEDTSYEGHRLAQITRITKDTW